MRLFIDEMPTHPEDCLFSQHVRAVDTELLEELEEEGEAEICDDCGGVIVDEEHLQDIYVCHLIGDRCNLDEGVPCDFLVCDSRKKKADVIKFEDLYR